MSKIPVWICTLATNIIPHKASLVPRMIALESGRASQLRHVETYNILQLQPVRVVAPALIGRSR